METVPGQSIPPMTTQPFAGNPLPKGPPGMPIQIALPGELQTIMQQWPSLQERLTKVEARPTSGGSSPWQGFALFLLGGSLMAAAVFCWPYLGKLL